MPIGGANTTRPGIQNFYLNVQRIIYNKQTFRINILGILENFLSIVHVNFPRTFLKKSSNKNEVVKYLFSNWLVLWGIEPGVSRVDTSVSSNIKVKKWRDWQTFTLDPGRVSEGTRGGDNSYFLLSHLII